MRFALTITLSLFIMSLVILGMIGLAKLIASCPP